jgi:hypothetical protein
MRKSQKAQGRYKNLYFTQNFTIQRRNSTSWTTCQLMSMCSTIIMCSMGNIFSLNFIATVYLDLKICHTHRQSLSITNVHMNCSYIFNPPQIGILQFELTSYLLFENSKLHSQKNDIKWYNKANVMDIIIIFDLIDFTINIYNKNW